jgi:hypothetical protein
VIEERGELWVSAGWGRRKTTGGFSLPQQGDRNCNSVGLARLYDVETFARKRGRVSAIGHRHDASLATLGELFRILLKLSFVPVLISAMVKAPEAGTEGVDRDGEPAGSTGFDQVPE